MGGEDSRESRCVLPAEPSSVPTARRAIRAWLADAGREDVADNAELAVSEVVTNALVHAGTSVEMVTRLVGRVVRVEVTDGNAHLPRPREVGTTSGTGRGLLMLEDAVDRWGAEVHAGGKVVWFELGDPSQPDAAPDLAEAGAAVPTLGAHLIELSDVPLLLLVAWREHAGALLREHLLVQIETGDAAAVLERHAAASEALSLLEEQWPELELDVGPDELLADAAPELMETADLTLMVPHAVVPSFGVLDELLDDAAELADRGLLLTPPSQPEVRTVRRWLTSEIAHQSAGAAPRARPRGEPAGSSRAPIQWDAEAVDRADRACLAADDTGRIVGASGPALALLGHDRADRSALVGQQLLAIIPERLHQAHLAGFALHLVTGRGPLLGTPIVVPAQCPDGTERLLELLINAHTLPGGRSVFVAELRPA